ncbi:hypothetical protein DFH06DRAFT_1015266 [Mycena polygramma]|nr:hypothetical protein DFH06DRAFT_1015266 [Mycena polygramma]
METIRTSSASFLITSSPIQSTAVLPAFNPIPLSPHKHKKARYSNLLAVVPSNIVEEELQNSVRELLVINKHQKSQLISMQSALVLNGAYCDLIRGQLAAQEESKILKKKGRLVGDGMPRLLTATVFVRRVEAFHKAAEEKAAQQSQKRVTQAERKIAMAEWSELEATRKVENIAICASWAADVKAWEQERDRAKLLHKRPGWTKPLLKGQLFSAVPKPTFGATAAVAAVAGPSNKDRGSATDSDDEMDSDKDSDEDESGSGSGSWSGSRSESGSGSGEDEPSDEDN